MRYNCWWIIIISSFMSAMPNSRWDKLLDFEDKINLMVEFPWKYIRYLSWRQDCSTVCILQLPLDMLWCVLLYMDDHEWWECHGNVYEIYRAAGPGPIRDGDFIGIYYPHRNRWFGCPYTNCRKYTCPGTPSWQYGFS